MKLKKHQRIALAMWLGSKVPSIFLYHSVISGFDQFCDGDITEWRVIKNFGMAGKILNRERTIEISGSSDCEVSKKDYEKEQITIEAWNKELKDLMDAY